MRSTKISLILIVAWIMSVLLTTNCPGSLPTDQFGWTILTPSSDSRLIYVSSSGGNDSNCGTNQSAPVKTLARGLSSLRDGYPDWLLLRKGDTWLNESFGSISVSGRSDQERIVIGAYGSGPRPRVLPAAGQSGMLLRRNGNLALIGIELYAHSRDPGSPTFAGCPANIGISWLDWNSTQGQENVLIEDLAIRMFGGNITIEDRSGGPLRNLEIRRCVIVDSYNSTATNSSGLYIYGVDGIRIEENVFDNNGWYGDRTTGGGVDGIATQFNHGIYLANANPTSPTTRDNRPYIVVNGNIIMRSSASGIQMRSGGTLEDNLFLENGGAMLAGRGNNPEIVNPSGVDVAMRNNVAMEGVDVNGVNPAARAIWIGNARSAEIEGNICAHDRGTTAAMGLIIEGSSALPSRAIRILGNTFYRWRRGAPVISGSGYVTIQEDSGNKYWDASGAGWPVTGSNSNAEDAVFPRPDATIADYNASLGGPPSFEVFAAAVRNQSREAWNPAYTATAANRFIRASFREQPPPDDLLARIAELERRLTACEDHRDAARNAARQLYQVLNQAANAAATVAGENPWIQTE